MFGKASIPIIAGLMQILPLAAQTSSTAGEQIRFFETKVRPVLAANCQVCHGANLKTAGLDLSSAEGIRKGGASGPLVSPEAPESSLLLKALRYDGRVKMPPRGKLSDDEIAAIAAWVKMGAPWPADSAKGQKPDPKLFWSFQPRKSVTPPEVNGGWAVNEIDRFVLAKLQEKGLQPGPRADALALLRRVTLDLTGLAPTEAECREFLRDPSPEAYHHIVERLLASPRYGEKWGRHWLDVARYADSTGLDEDYRYADAWRYRDYVIGAFSRDLPYDQFVQQQIAGDLLPAPSAGVNVPGIIATGFLNLGPKPVAQQDKKRMIYDVVDEQIDVTTRGFLGLTVACARCHDHKFDPIPTRDYYALAAIFANTRSFEDTKFVSKSYSAPLVPPDVFAKYRASQNRIRDKQREMDLLVESEHMVQLHRLGGRVADYLLAARAVYAKGETAAAVARSRRLDPAALGKFVAYVQPGEDVRPHLVEWRSVTHETEAAVAARYQERFQATAAMWAKTLDKWRKDIESAMKAGESLPEKPAFPGGTDRFFEEISFREGAFALPPKNPETALSQEGQRQYAVLRRRLEELKKESPPEPPMATAVTEGEPVEQHIFVRGNHLSPGEPVQKGFPVVLAVDGLQMEASGSGRLSLARWLTSPKHPLTARVMVNRIWQWHFGDGLVRSTSNFGTQGDRPTHPELLDYLAQRFIDSGWSIKAMHRLILHSSTYQLSANISAEARERDPENRWLSHFSRRRMTAEEIRDTLLFLSGRLDETMGGSLLTGDGNDGSDDSLRPSLDPLTSNRRSIYMPLRRSNLPVYFNLFDFGDATTTLDRRTRTNVAPQSLFFMNSPFVDTAAKRLADTVMRDQETDGGRVRSLGYRILGRELAAVQVDELAAYVAALQAKRTPEDAWTSLVRILLAANAFAYVD